MDVASYWPISLLNHNVKIFTTIMAKRLNRFVAEYVHLNQTSFIPGTHISNNIRTMLNVIHHCKHKRILALIVALDAEKAFDRLEPAYLQVLLKFMNFGPAFLQAISALYDKPVMQLYINQCSSLDFSLTRGMRQGCPLSPILFAFSLEPLAYVIRSDSKITGVPIGVKCYKLNMFANDIVVYLSDPLRALSHLISTIDNFGLLSGFSINYSKSELYPIVLTSSDRQSIQCNFNFRWVHSTWHHLGILIPLQVQNLFVANYNPLVTKISV